MYRKKEKVLSLDSTSHFFEGFKHGYDELTEIGGDRVAFIDERGEFLDEEVLLALMARYSLSKGKGPLVTPVSLR